MKTFGRTLGWMACVFCIVVAAALISGDSEVHAQGSAKGSKGSQGQAKQGGAGQKGIGPFVQTAVHQGLKGKALADTIHLMQIANGKGKGKGR